MPDATSCFFSWTNKPHIQFYFVIKGPKLLRKKEVFCHISWRYTPAVFLFLLNDCNLASSDIQDTYICSHYISLFQHNPWLGLIKPLIFLHICNIFAVASLLVKASSSNLNKNITFFCYYICKTLSLALWKTKVRRKMVVFQLLT